MRIYRSLSSLPADAQGAVVALGNFDGFHKGHQAVVGEARRIATELGVPCAVMTFNPHPRNFFDPLKQPLGIYPFHVKAELLKEAGVDMVYQARFNAALAGMTAEHFIRERLAADLRVKHVVTGENFTFGHQRGGNAQLLAERAGEMGFGYTRVPPALDAQGLPYSSTRIRVALASGDMARAEALLTRPYEIHGHVRHGDARGRQLGFPTANIGMEGIFRPAYGVYAVKVHLPDARIVTGVANLGTRPTVSGDAAPLLEVHCFDTHEDLYGKRLRVQLRRYLREERKFENMDVLKMQIAQDCMQARAVR